MVENVLCRSSKRSVNPEAWQITRDARDIYEARFAVAVLLDARLCLIGQSIGKC